VFKDFALIWWNELATLGLQPDTWDRLKIALHQRFVPLSYQCDFHKKLQRLDQGHMSVQDYYAELQKGMIHAGVHEETEDKICHFYEGLHTEIQVLIDYKDYNSVNHLFQLTMLAEKELQGCQLTRSKNSFTTHTPVMTPSRSSPSGSRPSVTPSAACTPSIAMTPSTPHTTEMSKTSVLQGVVAARPSSSTTPTGRTSEIKCHHCHGVGHFQ
jgi:hypothetical protein